MAVASSVLMRNTLLLPTPDIKLVSPRLVSTIRVPSTSTIKRARASTINRGKIRALAGHKVGNIRRGREMVLPMTKAAVPTLVVTHICAPALPWLKQPI